MCHEFYAVYPGALNGFRLSRKIIIQGYLGGGGLWLIHGEANEKCIITTSAVGGQQKSMQMPVTKQQNTSNALFFITSMQRCQKDFTQKEK